MKQEDVPRRTMDEWADKDGIITELAKQMVGKKLELLFGNQNVIMF